MPTINVRDPTQAKRINRICPEILKKNIKRSTGTASVLLKTLALDSVHRIKSMTDLSD